MCGLRVAGRGSSVLARGWQGLNPRPTTYDSAVGSTIQSEGVAAGKDAGRVA